MNSKTLITFIVGVILGYLLLYISHGSLSLLLNSLFLQTIALGFVAYVLYQLKTVYTKNNEYAQLLAKNVTISAVADARTNAIKLRSTGKVPVYMWGFDMPLTTQNTQRFSRPRLIPSGNGEDSYYWLPAPSFKNLKIGETFDFRLYLEDEYGNKWISDNGGFLEAHPFQEGSFILKVWSYKTRKEDWTL